LADAYGIAFDRLSHDRDLPAQVQRLLDSPGPMLIEVMTPRDEPRAPSLSSMRRPDGSMASRPLEDLWPFLPREEFLANMLIPPLPD
jgi:acetolactate synthase-1/2/3 large subunit